MTPLRFARSAVLVLAAAALSACDVPTALPIWSTTWEVPADSTSLRVDSLLPARVRVTDDRSAFLISIGPFSFFRSLGEACGAPCAAAQGATVPKPAFTLEVGDSFGLPADVDSVAVTGGRITVTLRNGFGFDPLRPSATARGSLVLTASSGGQVLARTAVDGTTTAFPTGTTLARQLVLQPAALGDSVRVALTLESPAGDPVRVDTAQRITADVVIDSLRASSATVRLADRAVAFDEFALDISDIGELIDRVEGGSILLDVVNPFTVSGTFAAVITGAGEPVERTFTLAPGTSTVALDFDAAELRRILASRTVRLGARGTVTAPDGRVTLTPSQQLVVATRLRLMLSSTER